MKSSTAEVLYNGQVAGLLHRSGTGFLFCYNTDYLASDNPPVSLTLPKQTAPFQAPVLFAFFSGLLAEGTAKEIQCRSLRLDENDDFTRLLLTAHTETIGAITIRALPEQYP